ncbi:MAG: L-serine ammonia-lyase, iron-sulfur-dependent, subunit alpha [Clostridiales bacterium]|nr:L-serine ammonia-lyase, iron-sulfur-dependent, subunit alpha [Clostridiales bacterium]MDY3747649.1 L-serine ammonia-lyase, iron-sulfur-dependent, subunit alpha [Lachnospiraceae bacterium]
MYHSLSDLCQLAASENKPVWQIVLEAEVKDFGRNEAEIFEELKRRMQVMENAARKALNKPYPTVGNLITGMAMTQNHYADEKNTVCGDMINRTMAMALSSCEVNGSMGKICAAPTAGSCGILPAVLISVSEQLKAPQEEVLRALLVASGIGAVITENATVSGSEGGCQAECGVAAAMAAAAVVYLKGGSPEMMINACGFSLMNCMGLVCDPVAGLVQMPCAARNASQAVNALISADMALSGMGTVVPPDEIVEAMYKVGRALPVSLRETALGGIAATPTGKKIRKSIFK